jgi:hypothetical protein
VNLGSLGTQGLVIRARTDSSQFASNVRIGPAGDINGDGLADLIVGTRLSDGERGLSYLVFGQLQSGVVELDDMAAGIGGFAIMGASEGHQSGSSVHAAGDVDGDGLSDLIVGAPDPGSPVVAPGSGSSYVIFGSAVGQFAETAVDHLGGAGVNAFSDGGIAKTLVGGAGNDSLTATAASVLYGGAGDDVFQIDAAMITALQSPMGFGGNEQQLARISGGAGIDTLALAGLGWELDLTGVANPAAGQPNGGSRIDGIEIIDLTGAGDNTLALTAPDVLHLASFSAFEAIGDQAGRRQLLVQGNDGDQVELIDPGWRLVKDLETNEPITATIADSAYEVWQHFEVPATVYVAQALNVIPNISGDVLFPPMPA